MHHTTTAEKTKGKTLEIHCVDCAEHSGATAGNTKFVNTDFKRTNSILPLINKI